MISILTAMKNKRTNTVHIAENIKFNVSRVTQRVCYSNFEGNQVVRAGQ